MTLLSRQQIQSAANTDLEFYAQTKEAPLRFPLDLDDFMKNLFGIEVIDVVMQEIKFEGMDSDGILGGLYPAGQYFMGRDKVVIVDRFITNPGRKRFTVAHEAGHYSLHVLGAAAPGTFNRVARPFLCRDAGRFIGEPLEWQADCYASSLLMPESVFPHLVTRDRRIDMLEWGNALSVTFGVSRQAAELRLKQLGYSVLNGYYHSEDHYNNEKAFAFMGKRGMI